MASQERAPLTATLAHRLQSDANPEHIADAIVSILQAIDDVLCPVIGRGGVDALYARGLQLTCSVHPWLAGTNAPLQMVLDLAELRAILGQQSSATAAAGGIDLLQTFNELLITLIGSSLTERLLASVWTSSLPLSGLPARGTLP
jgi:hypothetical protein